MFSVDANNELVVRPAQDLRDSLIRVGGDSSGDISPRSDGVLDGIEGCFVVGRLADRDPHLGRIDVDDLVRRDRPSNMCADIGDTIQRTDFECDLGSDLIHPGKRCTGRSLNLNQNISLFELRPERLIDEGHGEDRRSYQQSKPRTDHPVLVTRAGPELSVPGSQ